MPKKDHRVSLVLHEAGLLREKDSYMTLDGHLILVGEDKQRIRLLIFKRFKNRCCICGHELDPNADEWSPLKGDWHHPFSCSCVGCGELRCGITTGRKCHAHREAGVIFTRKADALKAFNKLYPENA